MVNTAAHRIQVALLCLIMIAGAAYLWVHVDKDALREFFLPTASVMRIGDVPLQVEIANTDAERIQGLSGRKELVPDGLLFVFPETGFYSIWMKDMQFPIDIIWIGEDLRIIGIEKNVPPNSFPRAFRPERPVKYILETDIHLADTHNFKEGDVVELPKNYLED